MGAYGNSCADSRQSGESSTLRRPGFAGGEGSFQPHSFKHGLYSKDLVLPGENPAELDQLRASFRAEHQPANTSEDVLVNELAENFWRLRRMREFETRAMLPENIFKWHESGLLAVVQRTMASAERGFHRALTDLRRLQKDRGFVPQPVAAHEDEIGSVPENDAAAQEQIGSVPSKTPSITLLDPNSEAFYRATGFRTVEELRAHCISQFNEQSKTA